MLRSSSSMCCMAREALRLEAEKVGNLGVGLPFLSFFAIGGPSSLADPLRA